MNEQFKTLVEKIEKLKSSGTYDLSLEEDLSLAIMNLVSLEEHFYFTKQKIGKAEYLDFLNQVRMMRKDLMERMLPKNEGETWCISKHLLAASMRLIEVGTKQLGRGEQKDAEKLFDQAYSLYNLFWAIRLKLLDLTELETLKKEEPKKDGPWSVDDIVGKLVNCCKE